METPTRNRWTNRPLRIAAVAALLIMSGASCWWFFGRRNVDVVATVYLRRPQFSVATFSYEPELGHFAEDQCALVKTHAVLGDAVEAVRKNDLLLFGGEKEPIEFLIHQKEPIEFLKSQVEASMVSPNLMEIRMPGREATARQRLDILEQIVRSYIEYTRNANRELSSAVQMALQNETSSRKERIWSLRRKIDEHRTTEDDDEVELFFMEHELEQQLKRYDRATAMLAEVQAYQILPTRIEIVEGPTIRKQKSSSRGGFVLTANRLPR